MEEQNQVPRGGVGGCEPELSVFQAPILLPGITPTQGRDNGSHMLLSQMLTQWLREVATDTPRQAQPTLDSALEPEGLIPSLDSRVLNYTPRLSRLYGWGR
jgi:hypothetical protein